MIKNLKSSPKMTIKKTIAIKTPMPKVPKVKTKVTIATKKLK